MFFNAGGSLPTAPSSFVDYWDIGFTLGAGTEVPLNNVVSMYADLAYQQYSIDGEAILKKFGLPSQGLNVSGGAITFFTANVGGKYYFKNNPQENSPYILGGAGYLNADFENVIISNNNQNVLNRSETENTFVYEIGTGADFPLSKDNNFFLQLKYCISTLHGESTQYLPLEIGFRSALF
jgi:opacity protein-like surface antigen